MENTFPTYKVLKFERNMFPLVGKRTFVAIIECSAYPEHPFRLSIENVGSAAEARKDVDDWIALREAEDRNAALEAVKTEELNAEDKVLEELNTHVS